VVLVLDASSSMTEDDGTGRSKLAAAQTAIRVFLDTLHLDAGDQAALVAFNESADVLQPLTGRRADLDAALAVVQPRPLTRIDLGIDAAAAELTGPRASPANAPMMVVLTDGRSTPVGPEVAVARAAVAKAAGITIFAVGLGNDIDFAALTAMASGIDRFYHSPSAADLVDIYKRIAVLRPCPAQGYWPGRHAIRTSGLDGS
jgi:Mg-chelatase subunit ChlD